MGFGDGSIASQMLNGTYVGSNPTKEDVLSLINEYKAKWQTASDKQSEYEILGSKISTIFGYVGSAVSYLDTALSNYDSGIKSDGHDSNKTDLQSKKNSLEAIKTVLANAKLESDAKVGQYKAEASGYLDKIGILWRKYNSL